MQRGMHESAAHATRTCGRRPVGRSVGLTNPPGSPQAGGHPPRDVGTPPSVGDVPLWVRWPGTLTGSAIGRAHVERPRNGMIDCSPVSPQSFTCDYTVTVGTCVYELGDIILAASRRRRRRSRRAGCHNHIYIIDPHPPTARQHEQRAPGIYAAPRHTAARGWNWRNGFQQTAKRVSWHPQLSVTPPRAKRSILCT